MFDLCFPFHAWKLERRVDVLYVNKCSRGREGGMEGGREGEGEEYGGKNITISKQINQSIIESINK